MNLMTLLPEMLLRDRSIPVAAKFIYVTAHVYHPSSYTELAKMTGLSLSRVSRMCDRLAERGWIYKAKSGSSVVPVPAIPPRIQEQMSQGGRLPEHRSCDRSLREALG